MDKAEIRSLLRAYLQDEFPNPGIELTDSTDLLDEWFIDSLGIIETVLFLETTFGIGISRADINGANFRSIATLSGFVAERMNLLAPN